MLGQRIKARQYSIINPLSTKTKHSHNPTTSTFQIIHTCFLQPLFEYFKTKDIKFLLNAALSLIRDRLEQEDCKAGWLLDGYPRTISQAEALSKFVSPSLCVNICLPTELLIKKITARRVCKDCGRNYNIADIRYGEYDMPPLLPKPSDCDKCHGKPNLQQRDDDKEEIVMDRLKIYNDETSPLINYYEKQNLLISFEVKKGIKDIPKIEKLILNSSK